MAHGEIPNKVFRERFLELKAKEAITLSSLALQLGWQAQSQKRRNGHCDTARVARVLGLQKVRIRKGGPWGRQTKVSYQTAVALCDALDINYLDAGV